MNNDTPAAFNPYSAPTGDLSVPLADGEIVLAGRGRRLSAALIDGILVGCITLLPIIFYFGGWANYAVKVQSASFLFKFGLAVFGLCAYVLLHGHLLAKNGQTIGKKILGIKISRTDGSDAGFTRIILRRLAPIQLIQLIPTVGVILIFIDMLFIFSSSKKCLHDHIADTIVIRI